MTDNNANNDCYKIKICSPDGKEEVYETNIAFLICDTGDRIESAHICYDGPAMDVFQLVKMGRRAILEMIPEKYRQMYEAFAHCVPEDEDE